MQTFPLELENALHTFNLVQYIPIDIHLNFFSSNISHFNIHVGVIALSTIFWLFFSFSSFGTMMLLFWFLIFKLLYIFNPNDLFIFSFSSDLNFFATCSGFYFSIVAQSDIQFLSSSSQLNIVWFSTEVLLVLSDVSFILNILFIKNDWKKVDSY